MSNAKHCLTLLLKYCTGWAYVKTHPHWSKPYHYTLSPRVVHSVIDVPVTGSVPVKAGSVFTARSPSRSSLALSHRYVKDGVSSNYGSHTQASPSDSNVASWALPQTERNLGSFASHGSSSLNNQDLVVRPVARHGSYKYTASGDSSRPQSAGMSAPFSTLRVYSGLSRQSHGTSGMAVPQRGTPSRVSSMTSPWGPSQYGLSKSASSPSYAVTSSLQTPSCMSNRDSSSFRHHSFGSQGPVFQLSPSRSSSFGSSSLQGSRFTSGSPQYVSMSEAAPLEAQSVHHVPKSQIQTSRRRHSYASRVSK